MAVVFVNKWVNIRGTDADSMKAVVYGQAKYGDLEGECRTLTASTKVPLDISKPIDLIEIEKEYEDRIMDVTLEQAYAAQTRAKELGEL